MTGAVHNNHRFCGSGKVVNSKGRTEHQVLCRTQMNANLHVRDSAMISVVPKENILADVHNCDYYVADA